PVHYYVQFMEQNGFYERVDALLENEEFRTDPAVRDAELMQLRDDMQLAPVDQEFQDALRVKLEADYPGLTMRFRSSTNAEDLDGFPCAGCYESFTGDPALWDTDLLDAIRGAWAGIWYFRTFEERSYHSIDHKSVAMALLVHHNFPDEEANGVCVTANPFDVSGLEPGFYINAQVGGEAEVVHPPPGITSDEFIYHFDFPGQPIVYISHSNLIEDGETVLTASQVHELGVALAAIHQHFAPAYRPEDPSKFYGLEVDFKFDGEPGEDPALFIKQARPHPGRGN
ncbi:MAG TPA: PEP/pyruvate-binding domain-containing protein, partial [Polyangiaceae bacterium]|nr:PEP/pyruvate-binding domain-containing protein [Polyangiaceae bacterium]